MKKTVLLCSLLLLPGQIFASTASATKGGELESSVQKEWKMSTKPLDFVQSLDNKMVFVLGNDSKVYIYSAEGDKLGEIPVDKNTTAIDIAPRGEMLYLVDSDKNYKALSISFTKDINISGSPFLGKEDAPVTMVVFSDFQCPFCGKVQPLLEQVLEENPDKVKIVFKNFPLRMHKMAEPAALAAIAAQDQGKFWQMHDALFAMNAKGLNKEAFIKIAKDLGLNVEKFKKDMASPQTRKKLARDMTDAVKAEVGGTPTLFINGRRVQNRGPGSIQQMINEEMSKSKASSSN